MLLRWVMLYKMVCENAIRMSDFILNCFGKSIKMGQFILVLENGMWLFIKD